MKKVLAIFFALCLAALLAPSARAATVVASGSCGENVTWVLDDAGTLTISGTGAMVDYDSANAVSWRNLRSSITAVVVEDGVTSIGRYAFCWCTNLKEVTIGKDVEHIGESAFSYCYSLTDITIPDSVTSVGDEAFHYCKSLISVKLPAGITRIEERMFLSCESLADITIPDSVTYVDESAFHLCSNLKNIYYGGSLQDWGGITFGDDYANPMYYAENAYLDGELLEGDVVISDDIPEIHDYAFISYGRITGLTIQNGVTDIGEHAFEYCDGLKSVAIGPDVTEIGAFAFSACENLTDITVLGNNVTIELGAFQLCGALTNLNLGSGVVCIGNQAFKYCDSLKSITIPDSVTEIGAYAFSYCTGLTSVNMGSDVSSIGEYAFEYCTGLGSFTIPDRVTEIGAYAFRGCTGLKRVNLGSGVTRIGKYAFEKCTGLTELTIPDSTTSIGTSAFMECKGITEVLIGKGVASIDAKAFYGCSNLTDVTICSDTATISADAFDRCNKLKNVYYMGSLKGFLSMSSDSNPVDGVDYVYLNGELLEGNVVVPDGVTRILDGGFDGFPYITGITLPDTVTSIGQYAFQNCSKLITFSYTDSVKSIGDSIFWYSEPKDVYYTGSIENLCAMSLGDELSSPMCGAQNIYINGELLKGVIVVPDGVTSIRQHVFYNFRGMTSIELPASVENVDTNAFGRCYGLKTVFYRGSKSDKENISITHVEDDEWGYSNKPLMNATWHYEVTTHEVKGQTVYYCVECEQYYCEDGTVYQPEPEKVIEVAGVRITDDNRTDVLGDNTVSYDPESNTLTLNNANITVTDQTFGIFTEGDLIIELVGKNKVALDNDDTTVTGDLAAIYTGGDLKICGDGDLFANIESCSGEMVCAIRVLGSMTLETEISVGLLYTGGSGANWGVYADSIYADVPGLVCWCKNAIRVDTGIYIADNMRVYNAQEVSSSKFIEGTPCTLSCPVSDAFPVSIGYEPYWLSFNGIQITSENAHDIMGDGTVYYDPETDTITLNNANHTVTSGFGGGYWPGSMMIRINVIGENHLTIERGGFVGTVDGIVSIFGTGSLDVDITSNAEHNLVGIMGSTVYVAIDRLDLTIRHECDEPLDSDTYAAGIYGYDVTLRCKELNIDVSSNLDVYGIYKGGSDVPVDNQCDNLTIKATTTDPEAHSSTAIYANSGFAMQKGTMTLMADVVLDVTTPITLPKGYVVKNAAGEFINGVTTQLTQADPSVPVVIAPKPVVVPTLTGVSFTLSFENEVWVNFYYSAKDTQDVVEQGMLVFYQNPGAADIAKADAVYSGSIASGDLFANSTAGIAAKEMGDERFYCAYAKLTDGTYAYSILYSYSPEVYARGRIEKSTNEELKSLCVAMLNYGAAAQEYFGYRTDDLMNAGLTAQQQALVTKFDTALFAGAVPADSAKTVNFPKTQTGFSIRKATVSFEGALSINYYLTPNAPVAGEMKLYIWNPETYDSVQVLTADNAVAVTMENRNGTYFASVSGIAPKDLDKTYYVAAVYTDAQGNTYCTGVIAYSLSRYCMVNANGNMGDLAKNTAMYGYYADNYFE